MKLVLIITDYGAFNNFLTELSSVIAQDNRNSLYIICSKSKVINIDDKQIFEKQNISFHFIDIPRTTTLIGQLNAAGKIRSLIKEIKPDLVHAHFTTGTFPTILFRTMSCPYWSTIHGLGMNSSKGLKKIVFTIVETICFIRLNRVFVVNSQDFDLVNKLFSKKVSKYNCFGFGCDIEKFNASNFPDASKVELRTRLGIKEGVIVIAFTGRYVNFKGFNLVIKSFKILNEIYPGEYKLILMGGYDPIHKTGLDQIGERFFSTSKDVINIGFTSDVDKYLSITDIFLFPSKKEGLPTCILEALSMGVPVVTFNARGNNDIIKNNYNGVLVEPNDNEDFDKDVDNIVNSLRRLALNADGRKVFSENALKDRLKYSRKNFIDEHLQYYAEMVKSE